MLAGWQKVADCYRLRVYVFRAARKIFAVTNQEQGVGELVTIIEPTPRSEDPTSAATPHTGPIARRVRTARPPRVPCGSTELRVKRPPAIVGDRNVNGAPRRSALCLQAASRDDKAGVGSVRSICQDLALAIWAIFSGQSRRNLSPERGEEQRKQQPGPKGIYERQLTVLRAA